MQSPEAVRELDARDIAPGGRPLREAVAAPRIHHQWMPDELKVEQSLDEGIVSELRSRGHKIKRTKGIGVLQAIGVSPDGKRLIGVHDPRVSGKAAGP